MEGRREKSLSVCFYYPEGYCVFKHERVVYAEEQHSACWCMQLFKESVVAGVVNPCEDIAFRHHLPRQ